MLYSYSFANRKRDLSDILSTVIKDEPRFISNFRRLPDARSEKYDWAEDHLRARGIFAKECRVLSVPSPDGSTRVFADLIALPKEAAKVNVGTMLCKHDDPALFEVVDVEDGRITVKLAAANGSSLTVEKLCADHFGKEFNIISSPVIGGNPEIKPAYNWNAAQKFRMEIYVSGETLAVNLLGSCDNQVNRMTAYSLADLARDLNRVALFGRRVLGNDDRNGEAGGLYYFATGEGALRWDVDGRPFAKYLVEEAAQAIATFGGEPTLILCSPGQAKVLLKQYDNHETLRSDERRGAYVARIMGEMDGPGFTVCADPDMPDTDAWVIDPAGFGIANLKGENLADEDATPRGFDGIRRVATGKLTFVFRNAKERCFRIKNLMASEKALLKEQDSRVAK